MIDEFWLFHCGYIKVPEVMVFPKGSRFRLRNLPFLGAAAFHSEHGLMMIDAPYGHEGPGNLGSLFGGVLSLTLQRFELNWSVVPRIEQMGYRASEVNNVLMTHMHFDHTGGLKELAHARLNVSSTEWQTATSVAPFDGLAKGYAVSDYRMLSSQLNTFDLAETYDHRDEGEDLFGDGSVLAVPLPGHTPGHTGYIFRMRDGREVFFLGDAVFATRQISDRIGFGAFPRTVGEDMSQAAFTLSELQRYHEANPQTLLLCSHDFDLGAQCKNGPIRI